MRSTILFLLAATLAGPASAATTVDTTRPLRAGGTLHVSLVAGTVRVTAWDREDVHVAGTAGSDVREVKVTGGPDDVSVKVELKDERSNLDDADANLEIRVPRRAGVEISGVSAGLSVTDVAGDVKVNTVSGRVRLGGPLQRVKVASVSGGVDVTGSAPLDDLAIDTVSGDARCDVALTKDARVRIHTLSGAATLLLPAGTAAAWDVATFSGDIRNGFGPKAERKSSFLPGAKLSFETGAATARVEVATFSGNVDLRTR